MIGFRNTTIKILITLAAAAMLLWAYSSITSRSAAACPDKYGFISRDLNCDEDPHDETMNLKDSTNSVVEKNIDLKNAYDVAIYYRNLDNRQWFGINENENFAPGSLLKLPLAMAYYKVMELDPAVMDKEFTYMNTGGDLYNIQHIDAADELVPGKSYSVRDLIRHMLQYSDNAIVPILAGQLNQDFYNKVNVDLEVYFPKNGGLEQDFLSVKTYGKIFRTLYNASYLNQRSSNDILDILHGSTFHAGIAAGVPAGINVSNKFGERQILDTDSGKLVYVELHDCGIIYARKSPYILCVMTKGSDYDTLSKVIAEISKTVYENR